MDFARKKAISRQKFLLTGGATVLAGLAGTVAPGLASSEGLVGSIDRQAKGSANSPALPASIVIKSASGAAYLRPWLAGFSYEKAKLSTSFFTPANVNLIGCFTRFRPSILRLGGNTVDQTTWMPSGSGGRYQHVAPSDITSLAAFLKKTRWRVIYGINLASNTTTNAVAEATYVAEALGGSLYGFEIGNEPDGYSSNGIRPATYTVADFIGEWSSYVSAIREVLPEATITGPASGYNVSGWTAPFALSQATQIKMLTQHYYRGGGKSTTSTMSLLLSPDLYLEKMLVSLHAMALSNQITAGFRLAEANSFYSGGAPGVSNAYGSALWAIDFLLMNAQYGSGGVNLHGGGSGTYDPYYTPIDDVNSQVVEVMPVFYGMLFVNQIAPGPMYRVSVVTELNLSAYAVAGGDGAIYIAIINKDASHSADVTLGLGASELRATSLNLSGNGVSALSGTTLGGASFYSNGSWSPTYGDSVSFNGTLQVSVAPASAVLLRVT